MFYNDFTVSVDKIEDFRGIGFFTFAMTFCSSVETGPDLFHTDSYFVSYIGKLLNI